MVEQRRKFPVGPRKVFKLVVFGAILQVATAIGQQVTGQLGSPSATTTIDGKQLPRPDPPFGGVIKQSAVDSTPW
jgi:arylsulfatase